MSQRENGKRWGPPFYCTALQLSLLLCPQTASSVAKLLKSPFFIIHKADIISFH